MIPNNNSKEALCLFFVIKQLRVRKHTDILDTIFKKGDVINERKTLYTTRQLF